MCTYICCCTCDSTEIQRMLDLHNQYESQKKKLTDQAFVEDSVKSEIEVKLESEYAEIDVVVSQLSCDNNVIKKICMTRQQNDCFMDGLIQWQGHFPIK